MAKRTFFYQTSDAITSFSTKHPKVLVNRVPWVITMETRMSEALSLLFDDGYADLLVLDDRRRGGIERFRQHDHAVQKEEEREKSE